MALPFVSVSGSAGIQPYGVCVLAALGIGVYASGAAARKLSLISTKATTIAAILLPVAIVGAHVYDVVWYQRERWADDPGLLFRFWDGMSLFGAILACIVAFRVWTVVARVSVAAYADAVAFGFLVALTVGRIGCAMVHDHPGIRTDSFLGVEFPAEYARMWGFKAATRMHDLGLEELLCLAPLVVVFWFALGRLARGRVAALIGLAYAVVRFGLDFLRLSTTEPTGYGLTAGQWCCVVLALGCAAVLSLKPSPPLPVARLQ